MKQILQLQSKKIEACEETNYQSIYTDKLEVNILSKHVIIGDGSTYVNIHIDEFLQLCDYIKENYDKK